MPENLIIIRFFLMKNQYFDAFYACFAQAVIGPYGQRGKGIYCDATQRLFVLKFQSALQKSYTCNTHTGLQKHTCYFPLQSKCIVKFYCSIFSFSCDSGICLNMMKGYCCISLKPLLCQTGVNIQNTQFSCNQRVLSL